MDKNGDSSTINHSSNSISSSRGGCNGDCGVN